VTKVDLLYHIYYRDLVSDIAIFVLKRDVKLQLTNYRDQYTHNTLQVTQQASLLQCYHEGPYQKFPAVDQTIDISPLIVWGVRFLQYFETVG